MEHRFMEQADDSCSGVWWLDTEPPRPHCTWFYDRKARVLKVTRQFVTRSQPFPPAGAHDLDIERLSSDLPTLARQIAARIEQPG